MTATAATTTSSQKFGGMPCVKHSELYEKVLANYSADTRPDADEGRPVEVSLGISLMTIFDVDEAKGHVAVSVWQNLEWKDPRLAWKNKKVQDMRVSREDIWMPDIRLYSSIDPVIPYDRDIKVVLYSDGTLSHVIPKTFRTLCSPGVNQTLDCNLKFGSWTYAGDKLDLKMKDLDGFDLATFESGNQWDLVHQEGKRNVMLYECCAEPYLDINYSFTIKKKV